MKKSTLRQIWKIGLIVFVIVALFVFLCLYAYDKQKQRSVVEMAAKVLSAAERYAMLQVTEYNVQNVTINFPKDGTLGLKGKIPQNGYVKVLADSRIEINAIAIP